MTGAKRWYLRNDADLVQTLINVSFCMSRQSHLRHDHNEPVAFEAESEYAIRLTPPAEKQTGVPKEFTGVKAGANEESLHARVAPLIERIG